MITEENSLNSLITASRRYQGLLKPSISSWLFLSEQ